MSSFPLNRSSKTSALDEARRDRSVPDGGRGVRLAHREAALQDEHLTLRLEFDPVQWERLIAARESIGPSTLCVVARARSHSQQPAAFDVVAVLPFPGPGGGLAPRRFRVAMAYIEDRHADHLTLSAIAGHLGISRTSLAVMFRRFRQASVGAVIREVRVKRAMDLLAATSMPIHEVAQRTGFFDQAHLARTFRRVTGTTPMAFRRSHQ
jgi:AraC-like DNA-binding protein